MSHLGKSRKYSVRCFMLVIGAALISSCGQVPPSPTQTGDTKSIPDVEEVVPSLPVAEPAPAPSPIPTPPTITLDEVATELYQVYLLKGADAARTALAERKSGLSADDAAELDALIRERMKPVHDAARQQAAVKAAEERLRKEQERREAAYTVTETAYEPRAVQQSPSYQSTEPQLVCGKEAAPYCTRVRGLYVCTKTEHCPHGHKHGPDCWR